MKRPPPTFAALLAALIAVAAVVGGADRAHAAPPTPQDDAYHVTCGETVVITEASLLANDSDPDGDTVAIPNAWLLPIPAAGSLQGVAGGVAYTPTVAADGTCAASDGFSYPVMDTNGETATAFAAITIVAANQPPVANDDVVTAPCGGTVDIAAAELLANDSDPDGDLLVHGPVAQPHGRGADVRRRLSLHPLGRGRRLRSLRLVHLPDR